MNDADEVLKAGRRPDGAYNCNDRHAVLQYSLWKREHVLDELAIHECVHHGFWQVGQVLGYVVDKVGELLVKAVHEIRDLVGHVVAFEHVHNVVGGFKNMIDATIYCKNGLLQILQECIRGIKNGHRILGAELEVLEIAYA